MPTWGPERHLCMRVMSPRLCEADPFWLLDIIPAMTLPKFSVLNDEWQVHEEVFVSPDLNPAQDDQTVVFSQTIKDGSISAEITPKSGGKGLTGEDKKELALVFRYNGNERCYAAGIGGWNAKYFISRMLPGDWQILASSGKSASLKYTATYNLRVEFTGSKITLFENDVPHLTVTDETYKSGQWGLRGRRTVGTFGHVSSTCVRPRCFVIMPFSSEMSYVYEVMKKVVEASEMTCIRADEVFVSRPAVDQIRSEISQADLVIVDFTGRNPNVYYEAGLADAWKKRWIVLAQSPDDLTFDVQHIRTIFYSDRMGADIKLEEDLKSAIRDSMGAGSLAVAKV